MILQEGMSMATAWWIDTGIQFKMSLDVSAKYGSRTNYWQRPIIRELVPLGFSNVAPTAIIYVVSTFLSITAFAVEILRKMRGGKEKQLNRPKRAVLPRTRDKLFTLIDVPRAKTMPEVSTAQD